MNENPAHEAVVEDVGRTINDAIKRRVDPDQAEKIAIICECSDIDCSQLIRLTPTEYERARADGTCFLVHGGHESLEVERIVDRGDSWLIVEKIGEAKRVVKELEDN
jgi:hypothetical protein